MLEYDRIDISEGISQVLNQKNVIFVTIGIFRQKLSYQPHLCNNCHDLIQKAMSFDDVAIVSIKDSDYRIHFWYMSKDDAISIMNNSNLIDKKARCNFFTYKN